MFYVAKKKKAWINSKVPRIWPSICKSKLIRGMAHIFPCVALRIITGRAVKQVLLHSISQPFFKHGLASSREASRNGQRKGLDTPKNRRVFCMLFFEVLLFTTLAVSVNGKNSKKSVQK